MSTQALEYRYDFVFLYDVQDGNPNGDPDAGNTPRIDFQTGQGLITDVCLKRKVRNYVMQQRESFDEARQATTNIFIRENAALNKSIAAAYDNPKVKEVNDARANMCLNYYDVRSFGAVMTTGKNAGQVRGPIQLTFGRSIDSIFPSEHTITRLVDVDDDDKHTMGRKSTVPYALYRTHGFISAALAQDTGFSEDDLQLFWDALTNMFDLDRSAARGLMAARKLIVFKHNSKLGNAPAHKLFDLVKVEKKADVDAPRSFSNYVVSIDTSALPEGVKLLDLI